jgi:hypothetical protein
MSANATRYPECRREAARGWQCKPAQSCCPFLMMPWSRHLESAAVERRSLLTARRRYSLTAGSSCSLLCSPCTHCNSPADDKLTWCRRHAGASTTQSESTATASGRRNPMALALRRCDCSPRAPALRQADTPQSSTSVAPTRPAHHCAVRRSLAG